MSALSRTTLVSALAGALALAAAAPAFAQTVSEVGVTPLKPTTVRISVAGKTNQAVRQEIRVAAGTVCQNAVANRELHFTDVYWCKNITTSKALGQFAAIRLNRSGSAEAPGAVILASK